MRLFSYYIIFMSSRDRCVNCQEFGGVSLSRGKKVCGYCGMSWNASSSLKFCSQSRLMNRTGEKFGPYYETSLNGYRAYVTPEAIEHEDVRDLVAHLKEQGEDRIHIFSGAHSQQGFGNGSTNHGTQSYGFYAVDKAELEDDEVTVSCMNFAQCPKMARGGVAIMAYCESAYGGVTCPRCGSPTAFEVQGKGSYICQAPNCGKSGYARDFGL